MTPRPSLRWLCWVLIGCSSSLAALHAQSLPPRDRPPEQTGTGKIKGRVVDAQSASGVPRARVRISGPQLINAAPGLTDDMGRFEFANLSAGRFFLTVEKDGYALARYPEQGMTIRGGSRPLVLGDHDIVDNVAIPLYRPAAITGRVVDRHGDAIENALVQALRVARYGGIANTFGRPVATTNDLGEFRISKLDPGPYVLLVSPRNQADDPSELQLSPTYFPGAGSSAEAQPISVRRAQTVSGLEIVLGDAPATLVSGTVVDTGGQPVQGYGFVNAQRLGAAFRHYGAPLGSPLRNGTFTLHLTPGEYDLETRGSRPGVMGPLRPEDELSGLLHISVGGAPISDLTIQLAPASVITGRILFDGQSPLPDNPQALRIALSSMPADTMCNQGRSEVFPDWTFRIDGAMGSCSVMPTGIGRWILKSARREDLNLVDQPVRLVPGQALRDIEVVFTDRRTELVLDVTDEHGLPTRDFVALVFSRDRKRWTENSRFVRIYAPPPPAAASPAPADGIRAPAAAPPSRPDVIAALPPGAYYVIAVEDLPVEGSRDPAVLETLASRATAITLAEGTPARVPLRREPALR